MKLTLRIIGVLCLIFGTIWFLQGINLLPGSFMTGQLQWAVYGAIAFGIGVLLVIVSTRFERRDAAPKE